MTSQKIIALIINQMIRNLHSEVGNEQVSYFDDVDCCYRDDGILDWDRLEDFLGREDEEDRAKQYFLLALMCLCASAYLETMRSLGQQAIETPKVKKSQNQRPKYFVVDPSAGRKQKLTPTLCLRCILYLQNPQPAKLLWVVSDI